MAGKDSFIRSLNRMKLARWYSQSKRLFAGPGRAKHAQCRPCAARLGRWHDDAMSYPRAAKAALSILVTVLIAVIVIALVVNHHEEHRATSGDRAHAPITPVITHDLTGGHSKKPQFRTLRKKSLNPSG